METKVCDWDQSPDDVQLRKGEWLCVHCRAAIAFQDILSAVPA